MYGYDDTICAPATSTGSGAVSMIRVSGSDALRIADAVISFKKGCAADAPGYSLKFGSIKDVDDVLVSVFRAPRSYTGEDSVEISCHASSYVVGEILRLLVDAGARMAEPGEFTRRAFVNGKMDLAQAEAVADVIAASTEVAHRVAMNQLKGHYSDELREIRDELLRLTSLIELELDFSEEDVEFADRAELRDLLSRAMAHINSLADSFRTGNAVRNGVPVAIVGAPNSGKSTLLNALLGEERAIVSDIPGTTRDSIEDTVVIDGILFRFIDTAGLRESDDTIEKIGIERALEKLAAADVVIEVIDSAAFVSGVCVDCGVSGAAEVAGEFADCGASGSAIASVGRGVDDIADVAGMMKPWQTLIRVSNKIDLSPAAQGTLGISAKTGEGLSALRKTVVDSQKDRISESGTLVTNMRHYEALAKALNALNAVQEGLDSGLPTDLVAEDLRDATGCLNSIFGDGQQIDFKSITDLIFSKFCIGK